MQTNKFVQFLIFMVSTIDKKVVILQQIKSV